MIKLFENKRPYGQRMGRAIRVCLRPEMESALRAARHLFGLSVSAMVRVGVGRQLAAMIPTVVKAIRDEKTTDSQKIRLIEFLRKIRLAGLAYDYPELADMLSRQKHTHPRKKRPPESAHPEPDMDQGWN